MAQVLSNENQKLLKIIREQEPASLKELARVSGRKPINLSRTLNTMSRYGIIDLVKQERAVKPILKITDFKVEFGLSAGSNHARP